MCGIAGLWSAPAQGDDLCVRARRMADRLTHRGPDDGGTWAEPEQGVAFGFRRLAIIDLSPAGHQPMSSASGRFTVVFNGEIYNHVELAEQLRARGVSFRGHSDTEVALAAFEAWGVRESLPRFVGMFAMAVWDAERCELHLLRDRLGIKPLYVHRQGGTLAFASELKALREVPGFDGAVDEIALAEYFRYLYVPAPRTIYRSVSKLPPGTVLTVRDPASPAEPEPYWSVEERARAGRVQGFAGSDEDAVDALEEVLGDAVRLRLRADVPLGAFLSGGIDSSAVVALMQEQSARPIRTFTIGFDAAEHDESRLAAAVARHLGTDHREVRLTGRDALELVPQLPQIFDEPLADPSQIPTLLICRAAREEVTVAVSGDGGDELFAGYNRYAYGDAMIRRASRLPVAPRQLIGAGITSVPPTAWDRVHGGLSAILPMTRHRLAGEKAHKVGRLLRETSAGGMYRSLMSAWQTPPVTRLFTEPLRGAAALDAPSLERIEAMMLYDQQAYLPDDLLAKVDRASMATSLEVRVPILDHRVVELAWRLSMRHKLRDGTSKWVLRRVLERRVPRPLFDRPKVGFTVPLADWLRGPLRPWAEELLSPDRLDAAGHLDTSRIRRCWSDFAAGRSGQHLAVWTVLMYQAWRERWSA